MESGASVQRAASSLPVAMQKTLQQANADTTTTMEDKEDKTGDREGPTWDLPMYIPTGEDRHTREVCRDWLKSNDGSYLSEGIKDDMA